MNPKSRIDRRSFLKGLGTVGVAAPFVSRNLFGAPATTTTTTTTTSPSEVVRHASFGASGMANSDLTAITSHKAAKLVCVADVDLSKVEKLKEKFPDLRVYQDWRVMLDKEHKNLDSVNVSTPDHMHAPIGMSAMQLGLHVYGQKPLTHDVFESRRLAEYAAEKKLVTQMGIQIHSSDEYRSAVELIQGGAIGKVKEVHAWSNKKWGDPSPRPDRSDPVPPSLDWDLWLGVAPARPFIGSSYYHPGNWRKRLEFGTGTFGDMGCHIYDPVFKALALTAPISVRSEGDAPTAHNWANNAVVKYVFPRTPFTAGDTVNVTWYDGDRKPPQAAELLGAKQKLPGQGSLFIGTDGMMLLPHVGRPVLLPEEKFKEHAMPKLERVNHWHQFVDAVRGNGKTSAHFGYAGPLTEAILLGGIATHFPQTTLEWDAAALKFKGHAEADRLIRREYRKGWEVGGLA